MPYRHAGEIGDIWKHLPLCEALARETFTTYHETNAASATHRIRLTPETGYGIFRLLEASSDHPLRRSPYGELEGASVVSRRAYLGSPALAMEMGGNRVRYRFYDIDPQALSGVKEYARQQDLLGHVETFCEDALDAYMDPSKRFSQKDFVFIDPYRAADKNLQGYSYFDVFDKVMGQGARAVLWYGYASLKEQTAVRARLQAIEEKQGRSIPIFEAWQASLELDDAPVNPGVPGCGIAVANLSPESVQQIQTQLVMLRAYYQNAKYYGKVAPLVTRAQAAGGLVE